ncbi:molybdopterin-dependent oxidoreductase [Metallosphaera tengchongensis]|uniref:Molybdopterin-dependent oxidoreductase n=1 Tax=Metallosphaera tengchongensis TaxID=1532350 RepID=A0A6N0NVK1_9CREN|nr:molybdopterin-dependent oxidoreductase [Metallosphaera tengchongensis]QKR00237.1 molybdopterin-dependent oxidoreductase [Metallosphaera tengchongensis]
MVIACTRDCYDTCIFDDNYVPLKAEPTSGFTCSRGLKDLARNERNRVGSAYVEGKEVSVEEAILYVAEKMKGLKGSDMLHVEYDGNQGLLTWYFPARLWNVLGSVSTDYSICSLEGHEGIKAFHGSSMGALPEEMEKYSAVAFWGSEAVYSFIHGWRLFKDKYKIAIDVRKSETAKRSEKSYIIRPGSDAFLAIAIMKILVEQGYAKPDLVNLEVLKDKLKKFDMDYLISATGLSEDEVRELADLYAYYRPLSIIGFALGRALNGGYSTGLISLIPALLGLRRGFYYSNSGGWGIDFSYLRGTHAVHPKTIGMGEVGSRIDEFKLLFVWNSNPVVTLPGGDRIVEAVDEGRLFLIVHDPFWSETAKVANVVIPAPTFLEKEDVVYSYWHPYLVYNKPIRPKRGLSEVELMIKLGKALGVSHSLLEEDPWRAVDVALRRTNVTVDELRTKGIVKLRPKVEAEEVNLDSFPTPQDLKVQEGDVLVFSAHPNYTNSQFSEVYGKREGVVYSSKYEGIGYLVGDGGRMKVVFKRADLPEGVLFMYKSGLVSLGKSVNSVIRPVRNRFGGPRLNDKVYVVVNGEKGELSEY